MTSKRGVEEVDRVVRLAKLDPDELLPQSQALSFSQDLLDLNNVRLLETTKELASILEEGQALTLRGCPEDGIVLCTNNKSFEVKEAETSNSMLLVNGLGFPDTCAIGEARSVSAKQVLGISYKYLELKECKPKLQKLHELLTEKALISEKVELKDESKGLSLDELEHKVQSSHQELLQGLKDIGAVTFMSKIFLLDHGYTMKCISHILKFLEEKGWSMDEGINKDETIEALQVIEPAEVIDQVFDQFMEATGEEFKVQRDKIARFFGEYLLQTGSLFDLEDFLAMWQQSVPESIVTDLKTHLRGLALVDTVATPKTIKYFPESNLPSTILDRLQMLFDVKERWTLDEIEPFIISLTTPKLNVNALLTKYARGATTDGVKYFCSKHGK